MKPVLMRHSEPINESFKIWHNGGPYRHNPWHYHPECEITYIVKGKGSLFIGDEMVDYGDDELVIFGPNLPHEFRSDVTESPDFYSESFSVHFDNYFLGEYFYQLPEVVLVKDLLLHATRGIRVDDRPTKMALRHLFEKLYNAKGLPKVYMVLEMFHLLTQCPKMVYLSSNSFVDSIDHDKDNRINEVYQYVMKNFTSSIAIQDVASIVNMTPTSFCRFFKDRTHRSFMRYVTEVRVGYACRLLLEGKLTIAQVAYSSGFGNLSHFNKQFRAIKQMTPTQFMADFVSGN